MVNENYVPKAIITTITASSKMSVKINDTYVTVDYMESRAVPDTEDVDIEAERQALWDACNDQVENQIDIAIKAFSRN